MATAKSSEKKSNGQSRPVTEAILATYLKRVEARIDFSRQDAKEQLESVEKRLMLRIETLERKYHSIYEELKWTQLALREVKSEGLDNTRRLERIEQDHGKRLERIEQDHGVRLKRIEEKVERLAA